MSIIFGGMRQLAFVVRDMNATLDYWTRSLGVGPFHVFSNVEFSDYVYRGAPGPSPRLDIALSWSGAFQIEIIKQTNDAPSAYADFLKGGMEGMHHVCAWYENAAAYDARRTSLLAGCATLVHEGSMGSAALATTARFAYFETGDSPGNFYFEISEGLVPSLKPFMTLIEESARSWDGKDPIRRLN